MDILFERIAERGFTVQTNDELDSVAPWQVLAAPANQPVFGSANGGTVITDATTNNPKRYYRVRVFPR